MPSFIKDTFSVGISKVLIIALSLAKSVIIARWLGPEANGVIAALAVYPSLFMTFGSLGIRQSVTYFVGSGKYTVDDVKTAVVQIWVLSTLLSLAVCYLMITHLSSGGENQWYVLLAILPIPFTLFNTYNTGIFLGQNKIKQFSRVNWLPSLFALVTVTLTVILLGGGIYGALLASVIGPLIMSAILIFKNQFLNHLAWSPNWQLIKPLLRLGIIYATALIIISLNYKMDVILLDMLSTPLELGIYSKGAHLIEYMWQIPMLFSTIIFARSASAKDKAKFSEKVVLLMQVSVVTVGALCIVLAIAAPWIIHVLFGHEFSDSALVLRILLPGVVLLTIYKVGNLDLAGRGKPWIAIIAMLPSLALNIGLNIYLIPIYGANGAAFASTISYSFAAIVFLFVYAKEIELPISRIFEPSIEEFLAYFRFAKKSSTS